ncbi:MAG TPA: radical SAM protein [Rickettsiales bacterium]|nr:radical SAM protein [Rickettsiales bacterium]
MSDKYCSDEFLKLTELVRKNNNDVFKNAYIYITENCQLKCKHCYLGQRLVKPQIMSKNKVFNILKLLKKLGVKKLSIFGGEPTLHKDFIEIVKIS